MNSEDIRAIVKESVKETLITMGFEVEHPHELQADMQYVRKTRKAIEATKSNIWRALITFAVPGSIFIICNFIKDISKSLFGK